MDVTVEPGKYIVAVSGGVDSMVLLDLLTKSDNRVGNLELIVAHFNHGIRDDVAKDEDLVRKVATLHKLPLEVGNGQLGAKASEEQARKARYRFLDSMQLKHKAQKIITAHHQDDAIETAIINILRGTGRRGLSAIYSNSNVLRPLLAVPKSDIKSYALTNGIEWHEDNTNSDTTYLRNYIRLKIIPKLSEADKKVLLAHIGKLVSSNRDIDNIIAKLSHNITKDNVLERHSFILLPVEIGSEVVIQWLRDNRVSQIDKSTINRLNTLIRTAKNGTTFPLVGKAYVEFSAKEALLSHR